MIEDCAEPGYEVDELMKKSGIFIGLELCVKKDEF